jgi:hypothetical protein
MTNKNTTPDAKDTVDSEGDEPLHEIKQERAAERYTGDGKATSPERETMYNDDTLHPPGRVGESGSQGGMTGREDQNPIGQRNTA